MIFCITFFPHGMTSTVKAKTSYNLLPGIIKDRFWCDSSLWPLLLQKRCAFHILCFEIMPRGQKTNKGHAMTWLLKGGQHRLLKLLNTPAAKLWSVWNLSWLLPWAFLKYSLRSHKVTGPTRSAAQPDSRTRERKSCSLLPARPMFWETKALISCCKAEEEFLPFYNLWQKQNVLYSSPKLQQGLLWYQFISLDVSHPKDLEENA